MTCDFKKKERLSMIFLSVKFISICYWYKMKIVLILKDENITELKFWQEINTPNSQLARSKWILIVLQLSVYISSFNNLDVAVLEISPLNAMSQN